MEATNEEGTAMTPRPALIMVQGSSQTGADVYVPKDMDQVFKLAEMLASSTMVPKDFKGQVGNCIIAMQWGAELGLKPLQAIQNIAVINGKPGLYGDIGKALLLGRGFKIDEADTEEIRRTEVARCTITRPNGSVITRTFSKQDAVDAGLWKSSGESVWFKYRQRQMAWRAFWFAARDAAADVLKGMAGVEELRDYAPEKDVTPEGSHEAAPPVEKKSKSASIAEALKKPTVAEVVKALKEAGDPDAIKAARDLATKIGAISEDDKKLMSLEYHNAVERFRKAGAPKIEDVRAKLAAATTPDEADEAGSMIAGLDAAEDIKAALTADYKAIRESLVAKE